MVKTKTNHSAAENTGLETNQAICPRVDAGMERLLQSCIVLVRLEPETILEEEVLECCCGDANVEDEVLEYCCGDANVEASEISSSKSKIARSPVISANNNVMSSNECPFVSGR